MCSLGFMGSYSQRGHGASTSGTRGSQTKLASSWAPGVPQKNSRSLSSGSCRSSPYSAPTISEGLGVSIPCSARSWRVLLVDVGELVVREDLRAGQGPLLDQPVVPLQVRRVTLQLQLHAIFVGH